MCFYYYHQFFYFEVILTSLLMNARNCNSNIQETKKPCHFKQPTAVNGSWWEHVWSNRFCPLPSPTDNRDNNIIQYYYYKSLLLFRYSISSSSFFPRRCTIFSVPSLPRTSRFTRPYASWLGNNINITHYQDAPQKRI